MDKRFIVPSSSSQKEKADTNRKSLEKGPRRENGCCEFRCGRCHVWVATSEYAGTRHRNHCPRCLWSKHLDSKKPGDRKSFCGAGMEPVGITFKESGFDSYGKPREGEVMLIHHCTGCDKISINRIAADDDPHVIVDIFKASGSIDPEMGEMISKAGVKMATLSDESRLMTQLFGKGNF